MRIGKRLQITNLRQIWPTEPNFSDWLVTEDGLALISEDIGVFVEDARRESRPGDYPADVVGHALGDENHIIVIENQFGKTNHDHLGKLLTYAAMHSAMTGIWISEHISNDHRKVIDWLNENTPSHVSLYLAQLKAYQIDDSPVAPQLDVVSRPNLQAKLQIKENNQELTQIEKWRQKIWEDILNYIASRNPPFKVQSANNDHWSNISIGRSHFWMSLSLVPKHQRVGCELVMNPSWKDEAFNQLEAQKEAIEAEVGEALDWRPMSGNKSARILLEKTIDSKNEENLQAIQEWMFDKSVLFYTAFHNRVKKLKPSGNDVLSTGLQSNVEYDQQAGSSILESNMKSPVLVQKPIIEVVHASMMDQDVDAVVNAANPNLANGGGIAGIIFGKAGPGLPAEIKQKYPNGTPIGTAVITKGYGLKQPYIIHTPGPDCRLGHKDNDEKLASAYRSCLEVADANHLTSIAYCSISTGIYECPLKEAASLALRTVNQYIKTHPETSLERILFAMWSEDEYEAFSNAYAEVTV